MESQISLKKINSYLRENRWTITPFDDYLQKIEKSFNDEPIEMVIPKIENLKDYNWRIKDFIENVSFLTNKNFEEVFEEIVNFGYDLMSFKFESDKIHEGVIPLSYASDSMKKIVDIVQFEACSEINPKSQYKRPYKEAKRLVENCELAQTKPGSFIINIRIPIDKTYLKKDEIKEEYIKNLGRRTIKRIINGIEESKRVSTENEAEFKKNYKSALNRNVCGAISSLLLSESNKIKIKISTKTSPQETSEQIINTSVSIDSENNFRKMRKMEFLLRKIPEEEIATIEGRIIELKRHDENITQEKRLIKIYSEDLRRNINILLNNDDYGKACDAHRDKKGIKISGMLNQREVKWFLDNPSNLEILN